MFHPSCSLLITVGLYPGIRYVHNYNLRLWDLQSEQIESRLLEGYTDYINSVAFSSDGKRIVSGSFDGTLEVWDFQEGAAVGAPFIGHDEAVSSVTFSLTTRVSSPVHGTRRCVSGT